MRKHQLDGLRFVLFLMVFATHYTPNPTEVGYLGYALPVFFVMSGFLITNVLLSANDPSLLSRLKVFYLRRILRICPAYYLVVIILIGLGGLTYPFHYLGYLINIKMFSLSALENPQGFHEWFIQHWRHESMHLWSLSVEEQFYVLYPLILYLTPPRLRTMMFFLLLASSILSRLWFISNYPDSFYGTLLPVCAEYFIWGCLFSWWEHNNKLSMLSANWALHLSIVAIVVFVALEHVFGHTGFLQFSTTHYQTPIAFSMGFFIWGLWSIKESHVLARVLSWRPFVYFGEMSYTLYLVHLIALDVYLKMGIKLPVSAKLNMVIGGFTLSLLMAMAIWHLFEQPMYNLRRYLPYSGKHRQENRAARRTTTTS